MRLAAPVRAALAGPAEADRLPVEALVADAWLHDSPDGRSPGPRTLDASFLPEVLRPWQLLLDAAEGDGIPVTERGYLRPAVVTHLFDELDLGSRWIGKGNREHDLPHLRALRTSARLAGLTRVSKGHVRLTRKGAAARRDPQLLWAAMATSLVPKDDGSFASQATALALLHVAAGLPAGEATAPRIADALAAVGWRADGDLPGAYDVVHGTERAGWVLAWVTGDGLALDVLEVSSPVQRALARAALFGPHC